MDGVLNINKPAGMTSYGVVASIRRLTGERRVGHAGTLDPMATGVLPVCLGRGTRLIEFLLPATKTYNARIELGITTDTYDLAGNVLRRVDPSGISRRMVEEALADFRGDIRQIPPMFSALKHHGRPLYQFARSGVEVVRQSRAVRIYRLEIVAWSPPEVVIEVKCSRGTYIRSLAHDLGQALGCGACLAGLVRRRYGPFSIEDAVTFSRFQEGVARGDWQQFVYPADFLLKDYGRVTLDEASIGVMRHGGELRLDIAVEGKFCRAYDGEGRFLGVLEALSQSNTWRPRKVLF